jgi:hypothetical protein
MITSEAEVCRRIAFMLAEAEVVLGIEPHGLPLDARIDCVLHSAMERPAAISSEAYELLYRLSAQARAQDGG